MSDLKILTDQREAAQIQAPDLNAAMDWRERNLLSDINCVSIAKIVKFYPATQTADVSVVFRRILTQQQATTLEGTGVITTVGEVTGEVFQNKTITVSKTISYPILSQCPVIVLGGGSSNMTFPIEPGDECIVLFSDRDIDAWYSGANNAPPNSDRMHDFSDAIVIVGVRSLPNSINNYSQTGPAINNGDVTIAADEKILLKVGLQTLKDGLDALCSTLIASVDSHGDVFDATTIEAIRNAQTIIDEVLK